MSLELSNATTTTAGILLLTIVAVEYGGTFLLRVVRGNVATTDFQRSFFRAGHAHAGVLVILSLIAQIYVDATDLSGFGESVARSGIPVAAVLMPAGFFLAAVGTDRTRPNGFIGLVFAGAAALAAGLITLGVGLLAV